MGNERKKNWTREGRQGKRAKMQLLIAVLLRDDVRIHGGGVG